MGTPRPDDFTIIGPESDKDAISAAVFLQESNDLKIEKLNNRIIIISVIIPCIVCAILLFAYMDIKERMVNVHNTGRTEVLEAAEELDTKINAMTVDIAGIKHRFETTVKSIESETARITTNKAEKSEIKADLAKIEMDVSDRTSKAVHALENTIKKDLEPLETMETRISEALAKTVEIEKGTIQKTREIENVIQTLSSAIKAEQSRTTTLEAKIAKQNETMAILQKELSLVKIKTDTLEQTFIDRKVLDRELKILNQKTDQKIDQKINMINNHSQAKEQTKPPLPNTLPEPRQLKHSESISEKDLLQ